jgi:hypothetical protein
MKYLYCIFLLLIIRPASSKPASPIGVWEKDAAGLPIFQYLGKYPAPIITPDGNKAPVTDDPYFIMGNYRLTLFTHVSGKYELLTSERSWGRLNQGDTINTGANGAFLSVDGDKILLTDHDENIPGKIERSFGCGIAKYKYLLDNQVEVSRTLSTRPSTNPYNGYSAFSIQIVIANHSKKAISLKYHEWVRANYEMAYQQRSPKKVEYIPGFSENAEKNIMRADFEAIPSEPLLWTTETGIAEYEGFPPSLFVGIAGKGKGILEQGIDASGKPTIQSEMSMELQPDQSRTFEIVIGYTFQPEYDDIKELIQSLSTTDHENTKPFFRDEWNDILPDFPEEKDEKLRQEMIWNAYVLEAMATYSDYYKETEIPSGTNYDYHWGIHVCARDHCQLLLAPCYYNPELVKSGIRYQMKKLWMNGRYDNDEIGYGIVTARMFQQSDNQLYFLWLIGEYLRITGDYDFLNEVTNYYPAHNTSTSNLLQRIEDTFRFFQFEISTGSHGLVKLLNSDWNDDFYFTINPGPYNRLYLAAESHVNTGMAIVVFGNLAKQLQKAKQHGLRPEMVRQTDALTVAFNTLKENLVEALLKEWEGRDYLPRLYFLESEPVGLQHITLLPQAFGMQVPEVPLDKKSSALKALKERLMLPESFAARVREDTVANHFAAGGAGENGGIWFAPFTQLVLGVSTFDKDYARTLHRQMTFGHMSSVFPNYWTNYWSSGDYVCSSLNKYEGIPLNMIYCSIPHSLSLYAYLRLNE